MGDLLCGLAFVCDQCSSELFGGPLLLLWHFEHNKRRAAERISSCLK